ncbi:MAG: hypothetical protein RJB57_104, partial [Actinomycetota bacterium]
GLDVVELDVTDRAEILSRAVGRGLATDGESVTVCGVRFVLTERD